MPLCGEDIAAKLRPRADSIVGEAARGVAVGGIAVGDDTMLA